MAQSRQKTKRTFTNSMLGTYRNCKRLYRWGYIERLAPMRVKRALSYGSLAHRILQGMYTGQDEAGCDAIAEMWVQDQITRVKSVLALEQWSSVLDPNAVASMPLEVEAEARALVAQVKGLTDFYRREVLADDLQRYEVLWAEQKFNVPFVDRYGRRHKIWRYAGKWDLIVRERDTGRVTVWDHKTTARYPQDAVADFQLTTQPRAYSFAALYLATRGMKRDLKKITHAHLNVPQIRRAAEAALVPDLPFWPKDVAPPDGFVLNVIRKKVPKKPEVMKSTTKDGKPKLSKAKGTDTTWELYHQAIIENGLDVADYQDVLDRLARRGSVFHHREEVIVTGEELRDWVEETRVDLEEVQRLERDPKRLATRNPGACAVYSRCPFHPLCYGDEKTARGAFATVPLHPELADDDNGNDSGKEGAA